MDENCKSMLLICGEWCVVSAPCSKATEVRKILSTVRLSKCKKLHSILYSHWGPETDRSDSRPIETNGTSILECYSILRACWCIFGHSSFLRGYICAYRSLCVFVCVSDILGRAGERGQIADSLSHITGLLSFIHKNKSTYPPSTYHASYDTCICPLLSARRNTHTHTNTHYSHWVYMLVCTCFSSCQAVWVAPNQPLLCKLKENPSILHCYACEWQLENLKWISSR